MRVILLFFVSFLLISCGKDAHKDNKESIDNNKQSLFNNSKEFNTILQSQHVAITSSGNLAYLRKKDDNLIYSDQDNTVMLKNVPAKRYWLTVAGQYVYIFWWVKFNTHEQKNLEKAGKTLYVNVSKNGGKSFSEPIRINNNHGVLPDLHVVADDKGNVAVVYLDERYNGHQIFTNSSRDGGTTWLEHDIELNQVSKDSDDAKAKENKENKDKTTSAVTPSLLRLGNKIIAIWEQTEKFHGKTGVSFVSRESSDFGRTWSDSALIHRDFDRLSVELATTSTNDEVYLFAVLEQGLAMFSKEDSGSWERIGSYVPGTEKKNTDLVSYFKTSFDQQFLYVSYISVEGYKKTDNHTEFQSFNRKTKTWSNRHRFDVLKGSAAPFSRSQYQDIKALKDGTVIIVWEDYRGILPSILLNYSVNQGKTWLDNPIALNKVGLESASFPFMKAVGNNFYVFYKYFVLANAINPTVKTRQLSLVTPKSKKFSNIHFPVFTLPEGSQSKELLKKRFNSLVALRKANSMENMEKEWDYLDPIYKAANQQRRWIFNRDTIDYLDFNLNNITVQGALAIVQATITYKMNEKSILAKSHREVLKPVTKHVKMKWGWFYDNWYMIPDNPQRSYLP